MKRVACFAAVFLLVICCVSAAYATKHGQFLFDEAGLLTNDQIIKLNDSAADISGRYGIGVYIVLLDDYRDYSDKNEFYQAAIDIYDSNGLGIGEEFAGVMLMLSMNERDYVMDFNGTFANHAFSERERDRMEDRVLTYLRNNDYYAAFETYLKLCDQYIPAEDSGGQNGTLVAQDITEERFWLSMIIGGVAAAMTALILVLPMRSAGIKSDANAYVDGKLQVSRRSDMFLRRSVTRTPKQSNSGGSSGRSYSGGGHSGRSGKF